jgi:hypothetical protein
LTLAAPEGRSEEVEALAAAALTETEPAPAPVQQATVKFNCLYCDEEVEVGADLAGKQTPCPHCRRVVKVPDLAKKGPLDWRKADPRQPGGGLLRSAEAPPEGVWGSTSARRVSTQALVEAEVIPVATERLSVAQWVARSMVGLAAVLVVGVAVWFGIRFLHQGHQLQALNEAMVIIGLEEGKNLTGVGAAEVYRGIGEYYIHEGKAKPAKEHLGKAQAQLRGSSKATPESDALVIDLALTQLDLGARDKTEISGGNRMDWDELFGKNIRQTLGLVGTPEGRAEAVRQLSEKLIEKDQTPRVESVVYYLNVPPGKEQTELLSLAALHLYRAGQTALATTLSGKLIAPYEEKPGKKAAANLSSMGPYLAALILTLGQQGKVGKNLPELPPANKPIDLDTRLAYGLGDACQGKWGEAFQVATRPGDSAQRAEALVALAEIAGGRNADEAKKALEAAVAVLVREPPKSSLSPWVPVRLARLGARLKLDGMDGVPDASINEALRARARVEVERARASLGKPVASLDQAVQDHAHPLLIEFLARETAHSLTTSSLADDIARWQPSTLRAFGYVGAALGEQDRGQ